MRGEMTFGAAERASTSYLQYLLVPLLLSLTLPFRHEPDKFLLPTTPSHTITQVQQPLPHVYILRDEIISRLKQLSNFTHPVNRPAFSAASAQTRHAIQRWMRAAGMATHVDVAGNVIGDMRCAHSFNVSRPVLVIGSHHDTVPNAGSFDGVYGVVAGIAVAQVIGGRENGVCQLPFDLRVVAFEDEEGNNEFGSTNLGAKVYSNLFDWDEHVHHHKKLVDSYNQAFGTAFTEAQLREEFEAAGMEDADNVLAYIEVHIEQGPVLERLGASVGVVDAISGQTRLAVIFTGVSGHAGTVPMHARQDALVAAAKLVTRVERVAGKGRLVATVGRMKVSPGGTNVIPNKVELSVDVRARDDAERKRAVASIIKGAREYGRERGVMVDFAEMHSAAAVEMSASVREVMRGVVGEREMSSGAGHDAMVMAQVMDVGMLFVRCRGGVSHSPREYVNDGDIHAGAVALLRTVEMMAKKESLNGV